MQHEAFQDKIAKVNQKASDATIECRYADNGDGTVLDYDLRLQWEKKTNVDGSVNLADPHDADNGYSWSASPPAANGTAFTDFLSQLNTCSSAPGFFGSDGFAGFCDWRLPTLTELLSTEDCSFGSPFSDRPGRVVTGRLRATPGIAAEHGKWASSLLRCSAGISWPTVSPFARCGARSDRASMRSLRP